MPLASGVVLLTSATLKSVADIAIVPVACGVGSASDCVATLVVPSACLTSRYWPVPRTTAGSAVVLPAENVPVEDAYWTDQPPRFCGAPAL